MTQQNPEITLSTEPVTHSDIQSRVEEFVRENTYGDTEPAPHTRVGIVTGGFASDEAPSRRPRSQRRGERGETTQSSGINPNGTFFITEGDSQGGMKMSWETWRYYRVKEGAPISAVDVIFPSNRAVRLVGKDAYNFLKIVGDRNAEAFSRSPRTE